MGPKEVFSRLDQYLLQSTVYSLVAFSAAVNGEFSSEKFEKAILGENHGIKEFPWRWRPALITKSLLYAAPLFMLEAPLVCGALFATASLVRVVSFLAFSFLGFAFLQKARFHIQTQKNAIKIAAFLEALEFDYFSQKILDTYCESNGRTLDFYTLSEIEMNPQKLEQLLHEGFDALQNLTIYNAKLQEPPDVTCLPSLRTLNLQYNPLQKWSSSIPSTVSVILSYEVSPKSHERKVLDLETIFPEGVPQNVVLCSRVGKHLSDVFGTKKLSLEEGFSVNQLYTELFLSHIPKEERIRFSEKVLISKNRLFEEFTEGERSEKAMEFRQDYLSEMKSRKNTNPSLL